MTIPANDIVAALPHTVTVPIPGVDRSYTLRAPTFGQVGDLAGRGAETVVPSDAIFVDAVREAVEASDLPDEKKAAHVAALNDADDADDAVSGLYAAHGGDRSTWPEDVRREMAAAEHAAVAARRRRARVEWAMRDVPALKAMRRHRLQAQQDEQRQLVALCLGISAAEVEAMPAGDVVVLHARAMQLIRPNASAEKN